VLYSNDCVEYIKFKKVKETSEVMARVEKDVNLLRVWETTMIPTFHRNRWRMRYMMECIWS